MAPTRVRERVEVTETVPSAEAVAALQRSGLDRNRAVAAIAELSSRLAEAFRVGEEAPIAISGGLVRVNNIAGVLRVTPAVEIDVAPKFLGRAYSGWREDFLAIASLTGEAGFLSSETVHARYGASTDLASLIGRVFIDYFWRNHRQPLRVYRRRSWRDWSIEGDIDCDRLLERSDEGLPQTATTLDRRNPYTAVIATAADLLVAEVHDPGVRNQVAQIRSLLPRGLPKPGSVPPVPSRLRQWEPLVELAKRIIAGFDVTLRMGGLEGPGFLVRLWQAWEKLVSLAMQRGGGFESVRPHQLHRLGARSGEAVLVNPDITVTARSAVGLIDAKYKRAPSRAGASGIDRADLYEALAFSRASGAKAVLLVYPRIARPDEEAHELGSATVFDRVRIDDRVVLAAEVEVRGIGAPGAHRLFVQRFASDARNLLAEVVSPAGDGILSAASGPCASARRS